ncbi:hypothetical protein EV356DRAFT_516655 [Viridothelium virens]|uniref:Uncharacterized protein n=1 Tax=Viridothelium virens TaxID=1048519 RepID=A0A6A6H5R7_VIRVR|nr:hypothetical protein EV356DRAFT_516655 [Viridothelium virens]
MRNGLSDPAATRATGPTNDSGLRSPAPEYVEVWLKARRPVKGGRRVAGVDRIPCSAEPRRRGLHPRACVETLVPVAFRQGRHGTKRPGCGYQGTGPDVLRCSTAEGQRGRKLDQWSATPSRVKEALRLGRELLEDAGWIPTWRKGWEGPSNSGGRKREYPAADVRPATVLRRAERPSFSALSKHNGAGLTARVMQDKR